MNFVQNIDNRVNNILDDYIKKPTLIRGAVHLVLMLYVARLAPALPPQVLTLFDNQYFRLFIFSMVLWTAQFSPATSILIAIAFMVTVNVANKKAYWEFMENTQALVETKPTMPEEPMPEEPMPEEPMPAVLEVKPAMPEEPMPAVLEVKPAMPEEPIPAVVEVKPVISEEIKPVNGSGCYPRRRTDMSKINGITHGVSVEDYQEWKM